MVVPVIGPGIGFTVIVFDAAQPNADVNRIEAVPGELPVTVPPEETVAMDVLPLTQVPGIPVYSNAEVRLQKADEPVTKGCGLTVTTVVAGQPVASL